MVLFFFLDDRNIFFVLVSIGVIFVGFLLVDIVIKFFKLVLELFRCFKLVSIIECFFDIGLKSFEMSLGVCEVWKIIRFVRCEDKLRSIIILMVLKLLIFLNFILRIIL